MPTPQELDWLRRNTHLPPSYLAARLRIPTHAVRTIMRLGHMPKRIKKADYPGRLVIIRHRGKHVLEYVTSINPRRTKMAALVRWERKYGPLPPKHRLRCIDGNPLNIRLSNWQMEKKWVVTNGNKAMSELLSVARIAERDGINHFYIPALQKRRKEVQVWGRRRSIRATIARWEKENGCILDFNTITIVSSPPHASKHRPATPDS